tara:strand:- start:201 stop:692 length:492 start_codon:yes stop_codon:yes gene_type:complete
MDISNNISSLENKTIEYLMNPYQYDKLIKKHTENINVNNDELDFYKERILQVTNDMLMGKIDHKPLHSFFLNYVQDVIGYLKFQDKYDFIQEEYKDIINDKNIILESEEDIDTMMYENKKSITLDNFVKKIKKKKKKQNYPQQKNFNLKDPKLKGKGVKKNKK